MFLLQQAIAYGFSKERGIWSFLILLILSCLYLLFTNASGRKTEDHIKQSAGTSFALTLANSGNAPFA